MDLNTDLDLNEKPSACQTCKLFQAAKSYCIPPEIDLRDEADYPGIDLRPPILVVGSHPGAQEDDKGLNFCNPRGGGKFLRDFLNQLETRWILTNATRCFPGKEEKDGKMVEKKPTDKQAQTCCKTFLQETIDKYKPRVIVCLGTKAAKGVLGKAAPKKITSARAPIPVPGIPNCWALCTSHPLQHDFGDRGDGTDLTEEYFRVFSLAEVVTLRGYQQQTIKHHVVRNLDESIDIVTNKMRNVSGFSLDIETGIDFSKKNPNCMSMWHPEASFLCMSVTWYSDKEYITYVFPKDCLTSSLIRSMVTYRIIRGHNIKYEIQGIYRFFDVDIYPLALEVQDTLIRLYLADQDRQDLGLKDYAQQTWDIHNWEEDAWREVEEQNAIITAKNKFITAENRKKASLVRRRLNGETHYKVMVPNPEKPGRNKGIWLPIPSMEELKPTPKLPANSANFGDINKETLFCYNAFDTVFTEKIFWESPDPLPDPLALEHNTKAIWSLSRTERKGLPADKGRLSRLRNSHAYMHRTLQAVLLQQPEVKKAVESLEDYEKFYKQWRRRGFAYRDEILDLVKPKGYKFYEKFVEQTVGLENFPLTEKKRLSAKKTDLLELSKMKREKENGEVVWKSTVPDEERTRTHDLWRLLLFCRQSQDMQSKFLSSFLKYIVATGEISVNDTDLGRIRTSYRMTRIAKSGRSAGSDESGGASSGRLASCIAEGSFVDTLRDPNNNPLGTKIEDVHIGDYVSSLSEDGDYHLKRVLNKQCTGFRETVKLTYTSRNTISNLILTPEHKVLTLNNGWVEAERLMSGTKVRGFIGNAKEHLEVLDVSQGPLIKVYDLLVEDTACFIANGLAVHNSDPNLQNLAHDKLLRSCIVAPKGKILVEFDYDRIEPVVLSVVANIKGWKEIFDRQLDLYRVIANKVLKLGISLDGPDEEVRAALEAGVTEDQREMAKTSTLAIMYEQSPRAFAARMGIKEDDAVKFFREFDLEFPEILAYKAKVREEVRLGNLILTLFRRKRSFPLTGFNIDPEEQYRRAINFNIQASASDITIWKLWEIYQWIDENNLSDVIHPVNIVHDAIWFEIDEKYYEELIPQVAAIMEDMSTMPFPFDVPLLTTVKKGKHLGKMKKYKFSRVKTKSK